MDRRLEQINQYLANSQRLFQALQENDLETVNHCLDKNIAIGKDFESGEFAGAAARINSSLREKMEAILQINKKCQFYAEDRCHDLLDEIAKTVKNRTVIMKYGARHTPLPRFIDSVT